LKTTFLIGLDNKTMRDVECSQVVFDNGGRICHLFLAIIDSRIHLHCPRTLSPMRSVMKKLMKLSLRGVSVEKERSKCLHVGVNLGRVWFSSGDLGQARAPRHRCSRDVLIGDCCWTTTFERVFNFPTAIAPKNPLRGPFPLLDGFLYVGLGTSSR
jgi:hypothetical protein